MAPEFGRQHAQNFVDPGTVMVPVDESESCTLILIIESILFFRHSAFTYYIVGSKPAGGNSLIIQWENKKLRGTK